MIGWLVCYAIVAGIIFAVYKILEYRKRERALKRAFVPRPRLTRTASGKHITKTDLKVIASAVGLRDYRELEYNPKKRKLSYRGRVYAHGSRQMAEIKKRAYRTLTEAAIMKEAEKEAGK